LSEFEGEEMSVKAGQFLQQAMWVVGIPVVLAAALAVRAGAQAEPQKQASPITEQPKGKSFSTPKDAADALYAASRRDDDADFLVILGPGGRELIEWSHDPKEREAQREHFAEKYVQMHRLVREPDGTVALYVGSENWPLPIPLVEYKGAWYFDADLGMQEVRYRRVGRNEMEALEVLRALVDAEKEYYAEAHHYTDRFVSTGESHDGLYWKTASGAKRSPIGPYLAHAGVEGASSTAKEPYHGYYYRILLTPGSAPSGSTAAGSDAKAGSFAIVAYPAEYRSSGVMTFLMSDDGHAREKDLGQSTESQAGQITSHNLDDSWKTVD
jgi:hypothetical protein